MHFNEGELLRVFTFAPGSAMLTIEIISPNLEVAVETLLSSQSR